jgi:hypothetical protein
MHTVSRDCTCHSPSGLFGQHVERSLSTQSCNSPASSPNVVLKPETTTRHSFCQYNTSLHTLYTRETRPRVIYTCVCHSYLITASVTCPDQHKDLPPIFSTPSSLLFSSLTIHLKYIARHRPSPKSFLATSRVRRRRWVPAIRMQKLLA